MAEEERVMDLVGDIPSTVCSDSLCILSDHHTKHKHQRGCRCRPCVGKRNRRSGKRAQAVAYRQAGGVEAFRNAVTNEETWSAFDWSPGIRYEAKSGRSVPKWITDAIAQVVNGGHGEGVRPALIIKPKGSSANWVVIKLDDLMAECREIGNATASGELTDDRVEAVQSKLHEMRALLDSAEKTLCGRTC